MLDVSLLLLFKSIIINIFIPLISWILFLWIFFWERFSWFQLYIYSWFLWIWIISFSLFNLQFFYYWIWIKEVIWLIILLLIIFLSKIFFLKQNLTEYFNLFKTKFNLIELKKSFYFISKTQKIFSVLVLFFISWFIILSFLYNTNFPSYADDSFWNWNAASINIYNDWWIKFFGDKSEILWRWRLGYPIFFPIYKSVFSSFLWVWSDIYSKLFQWMIFFFWIIFISYFSFQKTKNVFYSFLPVVLIIWLPLTFFHSVESYMEMSSTIYSIITIYLFYEFILNRDYEIFSLWLLFGLILANIKNEWLIVYLSWIIISLILYLLITKTFKLAISGLIRNKTIFIKNIFFILYFFIPFLLVRFINNLSFNPVWTKATEIGISNSIHTEILPVLPSIFFWMDNYNIILIWLWILIFLIIKNFKVKEFNKIWPAIPWFMIFIIFFLVFLLTDNYKFVLDQTTVNRVFTTSFVIICAFYSIILYNVNEK